MRLWGNMNLKNHIKEFRDFPKPGITFRDISPVLKDPVLMKYIVEEIYNHFKDKNIDLIAGIESRGLIFASVLAMRFNVGSIMVRKRGKLPGDIKEFAYDLEYGNSVMEIQHDAVASGQKVLIVDDLLATGGTCKAAAHLVELLGGKVVGCAFVIELQNLNGRKHLSNYEIKTLAAYDK